MLLRGNQGEDSPLIWEALALGTVPVKLKSSGFDRSFQHLPIVTVDSLNKISTELLQLAYVEALYRRYDWSFGMLTQAWYERLVYQLSDISSINTIKID